MANNQLVSVAQFTTILLPHSRNHLSVHCAYSVPVVFTTEQTTAPATRLAESYTSPRSNVVTKNVHAVAPLFACACVAPSMCQVSIKCLFPEAAPFIARSKRYPLIPDQQSAASYSTDTDAPHPAEEPALSP